MLGLLVAIAKFGVSTRRELSLASPLLLLLMLLIRMVPERVETAGVGSGTQRPALTFTLSFSVDCDRIPVQIGIVLVVFGLLVVNLAAALVLIFVPA
jgi:hypothetical protein